MSNTVDYVETMMRGTKSTLALYARAIKSDKDVSEDETHLVAKGDGMDACIALRQLPLEQVTPEHARWTDFVFTVGGPRIYVRNNLDDTFVLVGHAAGLETPMVWALTKELDPDAYDACELLVSFDFMDKPYDAAPFEFTSTYPLVDCL